MATTIRAKNIERLENILALCSDIYEAVGVLAERGTRPIDTDELLRILVATARIKAIVDQERQTI